MNETTSETTSELCAECWVDLLRLQREIRQLTEKLEYSQRQNSLLNSECDRLRSELREAEFRGRWSLKSPTSPSLPNEVLRQIFSLATGFEGLVFPRWDLMAEPNWKLSSLARRAIPLVCRKWHMIGLEFLYEHVALRRMSQIRKLLNVLHANAHGQRMGMIRRLEFTVSAGDSSVWGYLAMAQSLILGLPSGQLRALGIDCGGCHGRLTGAISAILVSVLKMPGNQLETLHLSCMAHPDSMGVTQDGIVADEPQVLDEPSTTLSQLHTLSLWRFCKATCFTGISRILLNTGAPAIGTLSISTLHAADDHDEQLWVFLKGLIHLETIHVVFDARNDIIANNLDRFFNAVPRLKHLILTPRGPGYGTMLPRSTINSKFPLEEITVYMNTPTSYGWIYSFVPITYDIKVGYFPNLQRIILHGDYQDGCLDGYQIFEQLAFELWEDAIACCTQQNIAVVSKEGHPIHLWSVRHRKGN